MRCDALVRPGSVVVRLIFREDGAQVPLAEDQRPVEDFAAQGATRRSQVAFIWGACTAVPRILVPVTWKTASNEAVKFDPRLASRLQGGG